MEFYKTVQLNGKTHHPKQVWFAIGDIRPGNLIDSGEYGYFEHRAHLLKVTGFEGTHVETEPWPYPGEKRGDLLDLMPVRIEPFWLEKLGLAHIPADETFPECYRIRINDKPRTDFFIFEWFDGYRYVTIDWDKEYAIEQANDDEYEYEQYINKHSKNIKHLHEIQNVFFDLTGKHIECNWELSDLLERIGSLKHRELIPYYKKVYHEFGLPENQLRIIEELVAKRHNETWLDAIDDYDFDNDRFRDE